MSNSRAEPHKEIKLPRRRYAIFEDVLHGKYAIVVYAADIERAPKWGGFVSWLGGVRPAETRYARRPSPGVVE